VETAQRPDKSSAKATIKQAQYLLSQAQELVGAMTDADEFLAQEVEQQVSRQVVAEIHQVALEQLSGLTGYTIRVKTLRKAGFTSAAQLVGLSIHELMAYPGIGPVTATEIAEAMEDLYREIWRNSSIRLNMDPPDSESLRIVAALKRDRETDEAVGPLSGELARITQEFPSLLSEARLAAQPLRYSLSGQVKRDRALASFGTLQQWLNWARTRQDAIQEAQAAVRSLHRQVHTLALQGDFERHAPLYYAVLDQRFSLGSSEAADSDAIPQELRGRIESVELDLQDLTATLRRYQEFGAKYIVAQRRVLLGDEMGLGKTVQALAAICHLARQRNDSHFLVVCPASILVNWSREIQRHTRFRGVIAHGPQSEEVWRKWRRNGGVALTTYGTLQRVNDGYPPKIALLVVDEAHYVKNPEALRTQEVADLAEHAERVVFMSGTPMQNHLGEFKNLIEILNRDLGEELPSEAALVAPGAFQRRVASVYLRRNVDEVTAELPDVTEIEEWEEFTGSDASAYQEAVATGNFMAMRRAAFSQPGSAKMKRLAEICAEAHENGRRVLVFSYFLDVLERVASDLPGHVFGPLTGAVAPSQRQAMIDSFTTSFQPGTLLAQISAGGEGLNIQAASVVILCEPQIKPALEQQAIARAHRIGQTRRVQVHRLLTPDSVDERMQEILMRKEQIFDDFIKDSHAADSSLDARDASEATIGNQIVRMEAERLGLGA
jgi:superfamily II DNA or RNA helicase